jgi:hypothetical protein
MSPDGGTGSQPDQSAQARPGHVPGPSAAPHPSTALPAAAAPSSLRPLSRRVDAGPPDDQVVPASVGSPEAARSDPALHATDGRDTTPNDGEALINGGRAPVDRGQGQITDGRVPINGGRIPVNGAARVNGGRNPVNGAPGPMNGGAAPVNGGAVPLNGNPDHAGQCTAPQLRRFIKSRPYVPMHELRRRFGIDGDDDDVTSVRLDPGWVYIGLPSREGTLLGDLLRAGEIGYELSLDPRSPIVIGVYPMRPIPRG